MKDRVLQGLIAGIVAWLPQLILTQTVYWVFHLTKLQFFHFAGLMAFNHKPHGLLESLFSESIVVAQMAGLGILFALLIKIIASPNMLLKGGIFGGFTWFSIYVIADLYKTKGIHNVVDFNTAVCNLIGSVIWGIALGGTLLFLNRKYGVKDTF